MIQPIRVLLIAVILLAACDMPVMTVTPTPSASPTIAPSVMPTAAPAPSAVTTYPILLTVVPRAVRSINVREAICLALYTQYQLWPYKLEIVFDEAEYQQCLEGRPH